MDKADDPVEVLQAMATRAAVALRVAEGEFRYLRERGSEDALAFARAEVRQRLAVAAASIGLRWLRTLDADGLVDAGRRLSIEGLLRRVLGCATHVRRVMEGPGPSSYSRAHMAQAGPCAKPCPSGADRDG